jgi:uncharacterized protein (TIGR00369 family)
MNLSALNEAQQQRVQRAITAVPFARLVGLDLDSVEPGRAVLKMDVREELKQNHGVVHGGAIATLIDSAMAFAIIPKLAEGEGTTTVDLTIHYLRPLTSGTATGVAEVLRAGRRIIVVSAKVFDDEDRVVATAISSYLRLTKQAFHDRQPSS